MPNRELLLLAALVVVGAALMVSLVVHFVRRGTRAPQLSALEARLEQVQTMATHLAELHRSMVVPATRGAVGETLLAQLLQNWLPRAAYQLQYGFRSGARADAVIRMGDYMVAVDAKFPLEAISRSMESSPQAPNAEAVRVFQKQIEQIASKYIRPEEGTLSFALLYVPSEAVYRYMFSDGGMLDPALRAGVVPVSPATLFAYLQTVSYGLRGLSVGDDARKLAEQIRVLRREFDQTVLAYQRAGGHLRNAVKAFTEVDTALERSGAAVSRLEE